MDVPHSQALARGSKGCVHQAWELAAFGCPERTSIGPQGEYSHTLFCFRDTVRIHVSVRLGSSLDSLFVAALRSVSVDLKREIVG